MAVAVLAVGSLAGEAAADWPEFRGPTQQGHAKVERVPLQWTESENVAWRIELPGEGWSSPVVVGDRIYLTAAEKVEGTDPPDYRLVALAIEAPTGRVAWRTPVFRQKGDEAPPIHSKNSHASPTPIVEGDRLYVHFGHMGTACLSLRGDVIWKTNELTYNPVHGNGGSPVIVDDLLILACDGGADPVVAALDKSNGRVAWKTPRNVETPKTFSFCTPLPIRVKDKTQVIVPGSGIVAAYDPASGEEIWRVRHGGYSVIPRPVFGHGLVFISTGYEAPVVMAIRPDGSGDVTDTHVAWTLKRGGPHTPSMLLVDDALYMVSDRGVASCLEATSGKTLWQERLGGNYSASPVYAAGRIYFQDEQGTTHVVAAKKTFEKLAENKVPERTLASLAVIEGTIFLRGERHLYRIDGE